MTFPFEENNAIWLPSRTIGDVMSLHYRTVIRYAKKYEWETMRVGGVKTWYVNWRSIDKWMSTGGVDIKR